MNTLTLAVAGGRKTQSIIERCRDAPSGQQILVLTYTRNNQQELVRRLAKLRPLRARVEVRGWFSFLLNDWVRPYLPAVYPGRRLRGLNFEGDPGRYASGERRFLDPEGRAYKLHLSRLAIDTNAASGSAVTDRLEHIYDEIHIDEVQDLNGYDLEVLSELFRSSIIVGLVGDIRQALIMTNVRDPKNKGYKGIQIGKWFKEREANGQLTIAHQSTTWRSNQEIASFADTIFSPEWGFPPTISMNTLTTGHDGIFAVATEHVAEYVERFNPLCLRYSANCGKDLENLPFMNIRVVKGLGVDRVLLHPTQRFLAFLRSAKPLDDLLSCSFYVALTRARSSVAIVADKPERLGLQVWRPQEALVRL